MIIHCKHQKLIPVDQLVLHDKNANKHPKKQIEMLAKILKYQGWRHPVVVSGLSGKVVAGHGRISAAKLNGWTEVPVDIQPFDDVVQEIAFLHSDNKIAELAEFDMESMKEDLIELDLDDGFDLELLGVSDLNLIPIEENELDEKPPDYDEKQYILEAKFPNDMEMMDVHDDLLSRGYIVKVK